MGKKRGVNYGGSKSEVLSSLGFFGYRTSVTIVGIEDFYFDVHKRLFMRGVVIHSSSCSMNRLAGHPPGKRVYLPFSNRVNCRTLESRFLLGLGPFVPLQSPDPSLAER